MRTVKTAAIWLQADPEFPHNYKDDYDWRRDSKIYTSESITEAKRKAAEIMRSDIKYANDTPEAMRYLRRNIWRYTGKWEKHDGPLDVNVVYTRDYDRLGVLHLQII